MICRVRPDIQADGDLIPTTKGMLNLTGMFLEYRWIGEEDGDDDFEIKYNGEWITAYSIDFEFVDEEGTVFDEVY